MKQLSLLILALFAIAGCGQSEDGGASATAQAVAQTAPAAETAAAPAAQTTAVAATAAAAVTEAAPAGQATESRIELAQVDLSSVEAAGFIEGQHYRRIGAAAQRTNSNADQIEVDEFFMHSCIHCFNLEPYVQAWLPNKPDYINFVRIPTTWNPTVRMHAQAFYTAQTLGKIEEMHMPFFREMHENRNFLETPEAMAQFFGRFGVSRADFDRTFNSFSVNTAVNRADELGSRYRVDATPTIIINGKYTTGPGMAGGYEEMFELIEALAAAELGR